MVWKEKFLRFLKEEGVYSEWVYNIREQHPTTDLDFWKVNFKALFCEEEKCGGGINYAFCWAYTRQGHEYWRTLSNKWNCKNGNYFYKI